jgi:hypothetical protein
MPAMQPMLFSEASAHTLGFIKAGEIDANRLVSLVADARPRLVFDLRPAPSFARGSIQRRAIFSLFERHKVQYFDVAGVLGVTATRDGLLNPALLIHGIQINILRTTKAFFGPIFFFMDDDLFNDDYFTAVANHLPHQDGRGWDIACWPHDPKPNKTTPRDIVFVSHANPEDNEIASWVSARLAAHGYKVWSDVTRLIGGELIWDTIEQAIRERAAKVIVLLSKRGHQKPGLLDEVNVAVATERAEGIERFVVPVRIDDLPFSAVRANLARKNIVDGSINLADAFHAILKILRGDGVPCSGEVFDIGDWANTALPSSLDTQWTLLFENRVEIKCWPNVIRKFRNSLSDADPPFINQLVSGGNVTFESWASVSGSFGGHVDKAGETLLTIADWPASNELVFLDRSEMQQALASLARQAWDRYCASIGMSSYSLANRSICWFLRKGPQPGNRVRFRDHLGVERTKALVGFSPRRGVYWHFAIEARPNIGDRSIRLVPHVVFSNDGIRPIAEIEAQHSLRRGFCRNWWNARWRDLLIAALTHMANGGDSIRLPVSAVDAITISARLVVHHATTERGGHRHGTGTSETRLLSFAEPQVVVGCKQTTDYPKKGLLQFGPVAFDRNPTIIRVGLVGTPEGIDLFRRWSTQFNTFRRSPAHERNSIPFPGFEAVFGAKWPKRPIRTIVLSRTDVINSILLRDRHQAVYKTSGLFVDAIGRTLKGDDVNVDIWYVVIPDEVYVYGRPESRVPRAIAIATPNAMGRQTARRFTEGAPSLFPEDNAEAVIYDHHLDFHHQLKQRLLALRAVTQVLRESSLATVTSLIVDDPMLNREAEFDHESSSDDAPGGEGVIGKATEDEGPDELDKVGDRIQGSASTQRHMARRMMQESTSFAWNIGTTTFFKAGGRPWSAASAREGVCYIGLIFKRDAVRTRHACCGAQMFLDDSDGLVFKGAMGPWYSPETGQFHLDRTEAARLLTTVLAEYQNERKHLPKEIFIHGRTRFNEEEWRGFCSAADPKKTSLTAIRITKSNECKLFSSGEFAVKRGTALKLTPRLGLLWTSGYMPRLGTYPGRETPNPLRVEIVRDSTGSADIERIMQDLMVLTKMNFNTCIYADGMPVTLRFAGAIGDVLVAAKDGHVPPLPFRYYI